MSDVFWLIFWCVLGAGYLFSVLWVAMTDGLDEWWFPLVGGIVFPCLKLYERRDEILAVFVGVVALFLFFGCVWCLDELSRWIWGMS